jgi:hypothetical protein
MNANLKCKVAQTSSHTSAAGFDNTKFQQSLVRFVCRRKMPFNIVTWPEFKDLFSFDPLIQEHLISSRNTLVSNITKMYNSYRRQLRMRLQKARSSIHLSADLWSSPNRIGFIGVHAQWVDEAYTQQNMLIGLPECQNNHSGPQQASHIMDLIRWFNIGANIGLFTADNAGSNDTCLRAMSESLAEEYSVSTSLLSLYPLVIIATIGKLRSAGTSYPVYRACYKPGSTCLPSGKLSGGLGSSCKYC